MKKIVLLLVMALNLFAYDDYIGVGLGYSQFDVSPAKSDGMSATLDFGHKYGDYGRIHVNGTYVYNKSSITEGSFSGAYDFVIPVVDDVVELYVGPLVGYTSYASSDLTASGAHYGAEAGVLFELSQNIELELGYNFLSLDSTPGGNSQRGYFQVNFFFDKSKYFKYE